jgi:hypothetical protein
MITVAFPPVLACPNSEKHPPARKPSPQPQEQALELQPQEQALENP